MKFATCLLLLVNLQVFSLSAGADTERGLRAMRTTFLQAEQYIKQDRENDYFALADSLKTYPLYPYLQYQWLLKHLDDEKSVQAFLLANANSRYAPLLHHKWMVHLGQQQQWRSFINFYNNSNDTELQCYFAQAQYLNGEQQAALESAKQFWLSGKTLPAACDTLFDKLKLSFSLSAELTWQRFQAALKLNNTALAKQLLPLFGHQDRALAEQWLKLHNQPEQVKQTANWRRRYPQAGLLFAHAITRWLESDPQSALAVWDAQKHHFKIPTEISNDTEKRLGMALAFRRDKRAYAKLAKFAGNDNSAQEWRVRAALNQQQWPQVLTAIAALNETARQEDKWQYWQARALAATGRQQQATSLFQTIASHRSFHAFLAAAYLQQDIQLNHQPVSVTEQEVETLKKSDEFQVIDELLAIDRKPEAVRQWWHAIADLDNHRMEVAAKLAQSWQWPSMSIFTLAKARHWDDMELRFPLWFNSQIQTNADRNQLDPALVFALIRQESAFDEFAGSPAGAIGLMQVMPKTAKQIAGELNQNWHNDFNLLNPDINIRYGSYYFKKVLDQFDGHFVLAAAAYNAGANRIKQWLPKNQSLPADIWIETIPYKETRGYVSSVLMYALIYQQRLNRNSLKTTELLQKINPG
ncbi:MAG: transglycosylase SLT domain-containing protein [Methylomonas sp.]|jgi:soluble lytic murein transglycosylase|uniref:transglycosylase SLT domain-containing protein n=1 Tax=Methylomonas sp. TaxID=418 RepID=UPI0025F54702|nr:transglycosylase SLT domain-containing protein [Methylomonas sp.]MCK9605717.1 transglycosylase SLT domain-containing protein [Methylomonas sp.]